MTVLQDLRDAVKDCPDCGGTGYQITAVHEDAGDLPSRSRRCECFQRYLFGRALRDSGVPDEFLGLLDVVPEDNPEAHAQIMDYCDHFAGARKHGLGLLLTGTLGTGKTMTGCQIVARAIQGGFSAAYITFPELLILIRRGWTDPTVKERIYDLSLMDFLFLDEVGNEYKKIDDQYVSSQLSVLFRTRRSRNLPLLIGTNLAPRDLGEEYGEHGAVLTSLLSGRTKVFHFKGKDRRRKKVDFDRLLRED